MPSNATWFHWCFRMFHCLLLVTFISSSVGGVLEGMDDAPNWECGDGYLPTECNEGNLKIINWDAFLRLLCQSDATKQDVALAVMDALSQFTRESAEACMQGFVTLMLALWGTGAPDWHNQVITFFPDGSVQFIAMTWELRGDDPNPYMKQWPVTVPPTFRLAPPWPPWPYPGSFMSLRFAQDFTPMRELSLQQRCDPVALEEIGCGKEAFVKLLDGFCRRCQVDAGTRHGLPCTYGRGSDGDIMDIIRPMLEEAQDRTKKPECPHAFLAALLYLTGKTDLVPPHTSEHTYRVIMPSGRVASVLHSGFRQVATVANNHYTYMLPMLDLSPFPFHSGAFRSSRANSGKRPHFYHSFIGVVSEILGLHGLSHVVLPGDLSVDFWSTEELHPKGNLLSFFIPFEMQSILDDVQTFLLHALENEFRGLWRFVKVSHGLWQIGEEPYRFSPKAGVAYRVFCRECIFASFYFYLRDGRTSLLPLAPWTPCLIPQHHVFPVVNQDIGGVSVPCAFDMRWLERSQRPPVRWMPQHDQKGSGTCMLAKRRLFEKHKADFIGVANVTEAFDLSPGVHGGLGLFSLMRLRTDSEHAGLHSYSDKIQFKARLLLEEIPVPRIYHMTYDSPNALEKLQNLDTARYVAKPTHLAATSFVYVMRDGVNIVNGKSTSIQEVAAGLEQSWLDRHVDDWATESNSPGIIIEELIEPSSPGAGPESTPDEFKCQTFFGELFFCEWVFVENMTNADDGVQHFMDAHSVGDRAQPSLGHQTCGIPNFQTKGFVFRDGTCLDCKYHLPLTTDQWKSLVSIVEKVSFGTDHIRIDVFITPSGDVVVNEANISFLRISKFIAPLVDEMYRRWLDGYRELYS